MNILIVSQKFVRGGLETQIFTQYNMMKKKHNFYFAFGDYKSELNLEQSKIYNNFNFNAEASLQEFCSDVDRLVNIIKENKIDIIHVHPFYSVFPAVFAAKMTNTPIVYTFHGYGSLNFPYQINDVILFQSMLESEIDKIFSVSELGVSAIDTNTSTKKTVYLPNSIDLNSYKKHNVVNNKTWALISRIDNDKIEEINKIISIMDEIDIEKICIYGDGNKKDELKQFIIDNSLDNKVILMGHCDNLYEELNGKYNGIIGIGRVAMESIAMGYPTLLIGYAKIAGIIDLEMYNIMKKYNFVNRMFPDISIDKLSNQIKDVYYNNDEREQLYNIFKQEYSAEKVYEKYEKEINSVQTSNIYNIKKIYDEIRDISDVNEKIYNSRLVYNILKKYIEAESLSINLKNYFINFNSYFNLLDINYRENSNIQNDIIYIKECINNIKTIIDSDISNEIKNIKSVIKSYDNNVNQIDKNIMDINQQIEIIEKEQTSLQDKINIKFLTYNTFCRMKNKKNK